MNEKIQAVLDAIEDKRKKLLKHREDRKWGTLQGLEKMIAEAKKRGK